MKFVLLLAVLLVPLALANDAIVWSNSQDVRDLSLQDIVNNDDNDDIVRVFGLQGFNLDAFNRRLNVQSNLLEEGASAGAPLLSTVRSAKYRKEFNVDGDVDIPASSENVKVEITPSWEELEKMLQNLTGEPFTGVLIDSELINNIVRRVKRVAVEGADIDFDTATPQTRKSKPKSSSRAKSFATRANAATDPLPITAPRYDTETNIDTCLFYAEKLSIVVLNNNTIGGNQRAYTVLLGGNDGDKYSAVANCVPKGSNASTFSFEVTFVPGPSSSYGYSDSEVSFNITSPFTFKLTFNTTFGFFLQSATLTGFTTTKGTGEMSAPVNVTDGEAINTAYSDLTAPAGFALGCAQSRAIFFTTDTKPFLVGLVLNNAEIQGGNVYNKTVDGKVYPMFTSKVVDCTPTFNTGSWMGIVVTIVLLTVLMFGFLMLNSVQTMDRFDDPKQKQLVINFKE